MSSVRHRWAQRAAAAWLLMATIITPAQAASEELRTELGRKRALVEELETRAAEESLAEFTRQCWHLVEPSTPLVWNWHLDAMCEHLEAVTWGHLQFVIFNLPPRNTKSLLFSVIHPVWEWLHLAHVRNLCMSCTSRLATRDSVNSRTIIQSRWFQRRWGHKFRLVGDQNVKTFYVNDRRGSRMAASFDSNVVGEGGDRLRIDDPIDLRDAENMNELERVNHIWDTSLFSRINDPKRSAKMINMQRVHEHDLCGHVREQHPWTWLVLPTEFDPARRCRTFFFKDDIRYERDDAGRRARVVVATRRVEWKDPRTKEGELLNPHRFDRAAVESLKKQGAYVFQAQQQQNPTSREGKLIKRHQLRYYHPSRPPTKATEIIISWDPNLKAKQKNDYACGQAWARVLANAFLLKQEHGRFEYPELLRKAQDLYRWARETYKSAAIVVLIEKTAAGPEMIADLRSKVPGIIGIDVDVDKERRVKIVTPSFESGNVWVPGGALDDGSDYDKALTPAWVQDTIEEWVTFPMASNDDRVDAMTQALRRMQVATATDTDTTSSGGPVPGRTF